MSGTKIYEVKELSPGYLAAIFAWFLTSAFVLIEPAPFDLLFLPVAFFVLANNRINIPRSSFLFASTLAVFCGANLLSVLVADEVSRSFYFAAVTIYNLLIAAFVAVLIYNFGYRTLERMMTAYTIAAVFSALIGVIAIMRLMPPSLAEWVTSYEGTRARAFFKDPNVYAPYLAVALVYAVDRFMSLVKQRALWGGIIFVLMFGLLVGFSRAAWGVSILAVVGYFFLSSAAERKMAQLGRYMVSLAIFALLGGLFLGFFAKEVKIASFIDQRMSMQTYDQDRFTVQAAAVAAGLKSFIGIGPGQSEESFVDLVNHGQGTGATHSLYVRVVSETGVFGILSFLGLLAMTAYQAIWLCLHGIPRFRKIHCVFAAAYFGTLVNSVVIDTLHWRHFFFVIGVIWGAHVLNRAIGLRGEPSVDQHRTVS